MIKKRDRQQICAGAKEGRAFISGLLQEWQARRILFITGKDSFRACGAEASLRDALGTAFDFRFSDFSVNPSYDDLLRGVMLFAETQPDAVVAVGGGSVMDMAKLINYFGSTGLAPEHALRGASPTTDAAPLRPLLAIPTTAGSGSEATHFAVLYRKAVKYSIADPRMTPSAVWLNPEFTYAMPPYATACTGMDALSQGIESYWASGATETSRSDAVKAVQLAWRHLENAVLAPTPETRQAMQEAAFLAGRAINVSKTTAAHAFSYALTSHYGLPHGHAVALMLPAVMILNAGVTDEDALHPEGANRVRGLIQDLARLLGEEHPEAAAAALRGLMKRIGLSNAWLTEHGFDPEEARANVIADVNLERLSNNPRRFSPDHIQQIVSAKEWK